MTRKAHRISVMEQGGVLELCITGHLSPDTATQVSQDVFDLARDHRPERMLVDVTGVQGRLSMGEIYFHVRAYPDDRFVSQRVAVLERADHADAAAFFETAAANVGVRIHFFFDRETALRWLMAAAPASVASPQVPLPT